MNDKHDHEPKEYSDVTQKTTEVAFQRAIINKGSSILRGRRVSWIDIELPVDNTGKARGKCIDLIGEDDAGWYVLCELKFRRRSRDNGGPAEAGKQLKDYVELLGENLATFKMHQGKVFDKKKFANGRFRLVVAANREYWRSWFSARKRDKQGLIDGIQYYEVEVDQFEFDHQKEKAGTKIYSPILPESGVRWKERN